MAMRMRSGVESCWRRSHCSTKKTKIALPTTSSELAFDTACADATMPARTTRKAPKYQAGAGGAFFDGRRLAMRRRAAITNTMSLMLRPLVALSRTQGSRNSPR